MEITEPTTSEPILIKNQPKEININTKRRIGKMVITDKFCGQCNHMKPANNFHRKGIGMMAMCKDCKKLNNKSQYDIRKEKKIIMKKTVGEAEKKLSEVEEEEHKKEVENDKIYEPDNEEIPLGIVEDKFLSHLNSNFWFVSDCLKESLFPKVINQCIHCKVYKLLCEFMTNDICRDCNNKL